MDAETRMRDGGVAVMVLRFAMVIVGAAIMTLLLVWELLYVSVHYLPPPGRPKQYNVPIGKPPHAINSIPVHSSAPVAYKDKVASQVLHSRLAQISP